MFGPLGMPELILIFVVALIIFGPRKLPELGRSLGKSLGEFRRASNELRNSLEEEVRLDEQRTRVGAASTAPAAPTAPAAATAPAGVPTTVSATEPTRVDVPEPRPAEGAEPRGPLA